MGKATASRLWKILERGSTLNGHQVTLLAAGEMNVLILKWASGQHTTASAIISNTNCFFSPVTINHILTVLKTFPYNVSFEEAFSCYLISRVRKCGSVMD